jgi:hypothetical protein
VGSATSEWEENLPDNFRRPGRANSPGKIREATTDEKMIVEEVLFGLLAEAEAGSAHEWEDCDADW